MEKKSNVARPATHWDDKGIEARIPVRSELAKASSQELLEELHGRGGALAAVAQAQLLALKKGQDYNSAATREEARDVYFPFGTASYVQMIHTKSQRLVSLARAELSDVEPNFEGIKDSALDIINYAAFLVDRLERTSR